MFPPGEIPEAQKRFDRRMNIILGVIVFFALYAVVGLISDYDFSRGNYRARLSDTSVPNGPSCARKLSTTGSNSCAVSTFTRVIH
jgi:hypothetical protein